MIISYCDVCQFGESKMKRSPRRRQKVARVQYATLAALRFALRQFLRFSEEAAQKAGITPQQHQALLAIKGFPERDEVTIGELAERLKLRHQTTVELVDRLAA